jgi:uncharacterized membrane protein
MVGGGAGRVVRRGLPFTLKTEGSFGISDLIGSIQTQIQNPFWNFQKI